MKNILTLSIIFLCVLLIGFGVYQKLKPAQQEAVNIEQPTDTIGAVPLVATPAAETPATDQSAMTAPASGLTATAPTAPKHYYADQGTATPAAGSGSAASAASTAERNFTITPQLIAKMHLVDKYKPGVCYGKAIPIPDVAIQGMLDTYPDLAAFVRQKYSLKTDLEVYTKMKQLNAIMLTESASSSYNFRFMDGQCCTETIYIGTVQVSGSTATDIVTSQESHTEQC